MTVQGRQKSTQSEQGKFLKLLPYEEIMHKIQSAFGPLVVETVQANDGLGRISAEVVHSACNIPEKTVSAMDGYAISSKETKNASISDPARFENAKFLCLGLGLESRSNDPKIAWYVSTGSPLPSGTDAVVRVEEVRTEGPNVLVRTKVPKWDNVSLEGEDIRVGDVILQKNCIINASEVALLIACGKREIKVYKTPRVGIISVGSELREFQDDSGSPQGSKDNKKKINNYFNLIHNYLTNLGFKSELIGIVKDDRKAIGDSLDRTIGDFDMIITIGGSSVGEKDLTTEGVLSARNSSIIFHGVRVVPIRPAGVASVVNKPVAILPGHAVSVALSFFLIALPLLNLLSNLPLDARKSVIAARTIKPIFNKRAIDALELVEIERRREGYFAAPLGWGSNLMFNLSKANGFVYLRAREEVAEGDTVNVELLGKSELERITCS